MSSFNGISSSCSRSSSTQQLQHLKCDNYNYIHVGWLVFCILGPDMCQCLELLVKRGGRLGRHVIIAARKLTIEKHTHTAQKRNNKKNINNKTNSNNKEAASSKNEEKI